MAQMVDSAPAANSGKLFEIQEEVNRVKQEFETVNKALKRVRRQAGA